MLGDGGLNGFMNELMNELMSIHLFICEYINLVTPTIQQVSSVVLKRTPLCLGKGVEPLSIAEERSGSKSG